MVKKKKTRKNKKKSARKRSQRLYRCLAALFLFSLFGVLSRGPGSTSGVWQTLTSYGSSYSVQGPNSLSVSQLHR